MPRLFAPLFCGLLLACVGAFCQEPSDTTSTSPGLGVALPTLKPIKQFDWSAQRNRVASGLQKHLTFYSFGVDASPTGQGFEFPVRLTEGPFTAQGLECPRCVIRPTTERTKFTLPPFGSEATLSLWQDRAELFTGVGGINAWRADNVTIETDLRGGSFRRDSSFNDAWLAQGWAGAKVAVDPSRHVWLGAAGRYLSNFGYGKKHWNTVGGSATFQFGH